MCETIKTEVEKATQTAQALAIQAAKAVENLPAMARLAQPKLVQSAEQFAAQMGAHHQQLKGLQNLIDNTL